MRKGWEIKRLGDACDKESSPVSQNQLEKEDGPYPIYGASGLIKNVGFFHQDKPYLSIVKDGSGVGRVTKMPAFSSIIGTLQYIIPKEGVDLNYLYYNLISIDFNKYVTGAAIPHIYFKDYKEEPFLWMPLKEQKQIVSILDKTFEAIDKAKQNLQRNLENTREIFQSEFKKIISTKGKNWLESSLGDCFRLQSGEMMTAKMMARGPYPVYGGNGVSGLHNKFNLTGSNVIVGRVGALCGNVRHITESIWLTDNAFQIVDYKFDFDNTFLTYLLNFKNLRDFARQSAQPVISNSSLKDIQLSFPKEKTEQKKIVAQLDKLSTQTKKLETTYSQKIEVLEELKKSILQKAFSGELTAKKATA